MASTSTRRRSEQVGRPASPEPPPPATLRVAADAAGELPPIDAVAFDLCLTSRPAAPRPWVSVDDVALAIAVLERTAAAHRAAAAVLLALLRLTEHLPFEAALECESLAYSTLLASQDFRDYLAQRRPVPPRATAAHPVRYERDADVVTLWLADPARLNALSAAMRDEIADALDACLDDPSQPVTVVRGEGRAFCSGGALDEFGQATDLAAAHLVRLQQSAALRIHRLGDRGRAVVHGAVIGGGVEMAAAAAQVTASADAYFRLPELEMGLIPGAGGTVTIPRRIGRHRACYLMLSGERLSARHALDWGLIDRIDSP